MEATGSLPIIVLLCYHYIIPGVGKTSIITRFLNGSYQDTYTATTEDTYKYISVLIVIQLG